ncbi:MAG: carbon-nitrogen hydrolase family protein [Rhodobacteraceae bacterium]|nr:carbon-nitrogen hydrolase family protein [Paracoccaceae bacterium]
MKLALYQGPAIGGDIEAGFARIEMNLAAAAKAGACMTVFPELFLPGYNRPDLHESLAQPLGGAWSGRLAEIAKKHQCGLTVGWAESADGVVYNAATCVDETGNQLAHFRKIQLFGPMEKKSFSPGSSYSIFEFQGQKAAILICYDIEFPQHCNALAKAGVTLIFVPTANPAGFEHVSDVLVPARAAEMQLTIVYANYCGTEGDLAYGGHSIIVGPDAAALASAGTGETLLITDISQIDQISAEKLSQQNEDYRKVVVSHDA